MCRLQNGGYVACIFVTCFKELSSSYIITPGQYLLVIRALKRDTCVYFIIYTATLKANDQTATLKANDLPVSHKFSSFITQDNFF